MILIYCFKKAIKKMMAFLFLLYFTLDKFVQQISIRGNPCNPCLNGFSQAGVAKDI